MQRRSIALIFLATATVVVLRPAVSSNFAVAAAPPKQAQAQSAGEKQVGTIKAISGNSITLTTDTGATLTVQVQDATRMVRVAPGQTDLKGATIIHLQDLQVGDRILVRGKPSDEAKNLAAAVIIAMKSGDVQARQEQERQDWQKRGIGGLVSSVDPASGTITISFTAAGVKKSVAIQTGSATVFRRYAPDSVKFDDAKPSSIGEIRPGDQLRARGNRNADNTEFAAEQVVSGAFRNLAGTISSIDAGANTLVVKDLATKRDVTVRISPDSQVRKLPQQMAQFIAMRLKGASPGGSPNGNGNAAAAGQQPASANGAGRPGGGGINRAGGGDFQQILSRMPTASLSDLQKGDAVMIVSTEGANSEAVTAITLLAGVEPILEASPNGAQMMGLSQWSLGGSQGGEETGGGSPQ